jgi:beta-galactosidase
VPFWVLRGKAGPLAEAKLMNQPDFIAGMRQMSRREMVNLLVNAPWVLLSTGVLESMSEPEAAVVPTKQCFLVQGHPTFLVSGSIHYFRVPNRLWRDRLLRAKRAGLNCISTYVAWNFHEMTEGTYSFVGDGDIYYLLSLCKELGLYVFLRSGPYIDAEWDAGGYPAWLIGKKGAEFRTMNPVTLRYLRRWYEHLIPRIATHQITRGGAVIMVQSENEYHLVDRPGGIEHLHYLVRTLRELGIEVPITNCNTQPVPLAGTLTTINASNPRDSVSAYRKKHPNASPFISEFWIGGLDFWGNSFMDARVPAWVRQNTMEALSCRGMYNFYMFYGGTNFGFWASNSVHSNYSWIMTRYNHTAPVAEGGALNEKYFAVKSANLLASNFQKFFCQSTSAPNPLSVEGPVRLITLRSPEGIMLFALPRRPFRREIVWRVDGHPPFQSLFEAPPEEELAAQAGRLNLPSGRSLSLAENCQFPLMLPYRYRIDVKNRVDFSNATVVGYGGTVANRVIIVRGERCCRGIISINGLQSEFVFANEEVIRVEVGGVSVLAVSRGLADRTWFADGRIVTGPAYVGEVRQSQHECWLDAKVKTIYTVSPEGQYHRSKSKPNQR